MTEFEKHYADTLSQLIAYAKFSRKLNHILINDIQSFIDIELFHKIYSASSSFPNVDDLKNQSYQTTAYIGYLRGFEDCLDALSRYLKDSFRSNEDEKE